MNLTIRDIAERAGVTIKEGLPRNGLHADEVISALQKSIRRADERGIPVLPEREPRAVLFLAIRYLCKCKKAEGKGLPEAVRFANAAALENIDLSSCIGRCVSWFVGNCGGVADIQDKGAGDWYKYTPYEKMQSAAVFDFQNQ